MVLVPEPARVARVFVCLGVRFCASSMIRNLFRKVRPRMKFSDFTLMRERMSSMVEFLDQSWPPPAISLLPAPRRSEEHTSELQSLMRISYAVFCLKKKTTQKIQLKH